MKVHLMAPDADFDPERPEPSLSDDLAQDLQLDYLWDAMSAGDPFLREVSRAALLRPVSDPKIVLHRQRALADCLRNRDILERLYAIVVDAVNAHRGLYTFTIANHPERELRYAVKLLTILTGHLDGLRQLRPEIEDGFASPAFRGLAEVIAEELDDGYMLALRGMLRELDFPEGMLMSAGIGPGGTVASQILRRGKDSNRRFFTRIPLKRPLFAFTLPDRDEAGASALTELAERSVNEVANAASQALDHVQSFFSALHVELGFYLACCTLVDALNGLGAPTCTPDPLTEARTSAVGLYDPCLALRTGEAPVGNDLELGSSPLLLITGANRGGKSTMLRALGTAQLMMQAGMPAPAERFGARPVGRVFSHWAREEDGGLVHGKLDEELDRMEGIIAEIRPNDLLLCNESFASTNEAEGSEILFDLTAALVAAGVQLRSVTHLYDYASSTVDAPELRAVCLRAPRSEGGGRSYRLEPGAPLPTSFGLDLYDRVFGTSYATQPTAQRASTLPTPMK